MQPASQKNIFVIMPFVQGGTRDQQRLTSFFTNHIRKPVESARLFNSYRVYRSGETFDINAEIIRDLARADVVIADLSGESPNPNVMYELGVRLATSDKPVILIREKLATNKRIFDISGFFTFEYDPYDYLPLEEHLVAKLERFESGEEISENPILRIIRQELKVATTSPRALSEQQQATLVYSGIRTAANIVGRAYGPKGVGLASEGPVGPGEIVYSGAQILSSIRLSNPFEMRGLQLVADVAKQMIFEYGDGAKLAAILTYALITEASNLRSQGCSRDEILGHYEESLDLIRTYLKSTSAAATNLTSVATTAARDVKPPDHLVETFTTVGEAGFVQIYKGQPGRTKVRIQHNFTIDTGFATPEFLEHYGGSADLQDCVILLYPRRITTMQELLPLLSKVVETKQPLVIVADGIDREALTTLLLNLERGVIQCVAIRPPAHGDRRFQILQDIAVLTGGQIINEGRGRSLENTPLSDLGRAKRIVVTRDHAEIIKPAGNRTEVLNRATLLAQLIGTTSSEYDADQLRERRARLLGKVAEIWIGGLTAQDVVEKHYRYTSALAAMTAARQGGVNAGCGTAYVRASQRLRDTPTAAAFAKALHYPLAQLARNANVEEAALQSSTSDDGNWDDRFLDPTDILIRALELGYSSTKAFLTTGSWTVAAT